VSRLRDANGKTPEWVPLSQNTSIRRAQKGRSWAPFFKGNRFALLAGVLVIMLLLILIRTGSLQIFSSGEINVLETVGSDGEIVLEAPRGDIVDRDGRPLAVSDAIHRVSLISTGMTNAQLNRFLLDVAILFDEFDCSFRSPLLNWFDVPSDMRGENLLARDQSLSFVFRQPLEDIIRWQTDPNVLNLVDPEKANTARKMKRVVRERRFIAVNLS
jgi:cell division protein FtsI/penicillin-binding protein 2